MISLSKAAVLLSVLVVVNGFSHFRDRIPNGRSMKHPCKVNYMWYGVGHKNPQGGGDRNPFGEDFAKYGFEWNKCLCQADSDNDGRTNGEELGDPGCKWKPGQYSSNIDISHPGICEPIDSQECLQVNKFLDCSLDVEFKCDAIKEPDVKNITLRFPETAVPAQETTYICQTFNISVDVDSHLIATTPMISNRNVMHHMIVFECNENEASGAWARYSSPSPCNGMAACSTIIGSWTLGIHGQCLHDAAGIKLTKTIVKTVVMQLHWNNPERRSDYVDSSGITFYHTPKLRHYDAGTFVVGPVAIQIPPGYPHYQTTGGCSGQCMNKTLGGSPMYIVRVAAHMHYLGSNFSFEHIRGGNVINRVTLAQYRYDTPEPTDLQIPFTVMPGDELKVVCGFSSKSKTDFTHWGEETKDEMCLAFLMYYPNRATGRFCLTTNGYGICDIGQLTPKAIQESMSAHCNYSVFKTVLEKALFPMVVMCDSSGIVCKPGCEEAMASVKNHNCLNSPVADFVKFPMQRFDYTKGRTLLNMLASCDPKPVFTEEDKPAAPNGVCEPRPQPSCIDDGNVACGGLQLKFNIFVFLAVIFGFVIL